LVKPTGVVLFNLGGPDGPEAVQPFLQNLFSDPAILRVPGLLRWLLARLISRRRKAEAQEIYRELGGGSPLLANTEVQASALEAALNAEAERPNAYRVFTAMRYWHPMSDEVAAAVKAADCGRLVLLPLYPQFSTTTSASSLADWRDAARRIGLDLPSCAVCCYPREPGFINEVAGRLRATLEAVGPEPLPRVLFSAHGLPKRIVEAGDPYQWQVEQTAAAIVDRLGEAMPEGVVCYQSRVGPLEWIGPATDDEIRRAGKDGRAVVVVPIAFVSEHSETLVELDITYRALAESVGVPSYHRVATVDDGDDFIAGLARLVRQAEASGESPICDGETRVCPERFPCCLKGS
jgi:ferrochelatase